MKKRIFIYIWQMRVQAASPRVGKLVCETRKFEECQAPKSKKDVTRITNYYTEILKENEKRAGRMGLSDEKKEEIIAKSAAIELERDKQLQEIHNEISFRGEIKKSSVYFDPITKHFFKKK